MAKETVNIKNKKKCTIFVHGKPIEYMGLRDNVPYDREIKLLEREGFIDLVGP